MTSLVRRAVPIAATAAVLLAGAVPGSALAAKGPKTDQLAACEGSSVKGLGSSFQNPAEQVWTAGFSTSKSKLACAGVGKPTVKYEQGQAEKGSGACLKDFGEGGATTKFNAFPGPCGTDEAPSTKTKEEMEKGSEAAAEKGEGIQSIPVIQGALAVIVHLPEGCKASSEVRLNKSTQKLGRLALEESTVAEIYAGELKTWKQVIAAQKSGADKLTCAVPAEEESEIKVVVRLDKSGTTHIFKAFLKQAQETELEMEEFFQINEHSAGKEHSEPCKAKLEPEKKTWAQVAEGCENQRWPLAAHVVRPEESGNPGVVKEVATQPSSIGYADLAVAREKGEFSKKGEGGENTPGEQNTRFWAVLSDTKPTSKKVEYADPSTNGDVEALANSNCAKTVYALKAGEKFPPKTTRLDWSKVIGLEVSKTYGICGLSYVIEPRLFYGFLHKETPAITEEESKKVATTVSNYLRFVLSGKEEGGGELLLNHDYLPIPKKALKAAELGAEEIGSKEA